MKNISILIYEIILLIFTIILKFVVNTNYSDILMCFFWILSVVLLYIFIGFKKDNNKLKRNILNITTIILLIYILATYMFGLFFGFLRNSYSLNIKGIITNSYLPLIMIICEELIRHMIAYKGKKELVILTILFSIIDILMLYNANQNIGIYKMFVFITTLCLPSIARNALASYLTYKVSYLPGLLLRLYFGISIYILPIFPDIGNFFTSVLGVLIPYIIYMKTSKIIIKDEKVKLKRIDSKIYYLYTPTVFMLLCVVILVSGVFKYHLIAVASGSMEPVFYRGDAVLYEKTKGIDDLKVDQVIVFNHDGKYITHRIMSIEKKDDIYLIQTKGDNNEEKDNYLTDVKDVRGIIKLRIKWIGYPTVWFTELFS